jgi:hypothetical protein
MYKYKVSITHPHGFCALWLKAISHIDYCNNNESEVYIEIIQPDYGAGNLWNKVFEQPFNISEEEAEKLSVATDFDFIGRNKPHSDNGGYFQFSYDDGGDRSRFKNEKFLQHYRDIVNNQLIVKQKYVSIVDNFLTPYSGSKILGVHKRSREHFTVGHGKGQAEKTSFNKIKSYLEDVSEYDYIFVMSDETGFYEDMQNLFPKKVIYFDDKSYLDRNNMLDLHRHEYLDEEARRNIFDNLISELLIFARCDKRIMSTSNVIITSNFFAKNNNFTYYDDDVSYQ